MIIIIIISYEKPGQIFTIIQNLKHQDTKLRIVLRLVLTYYAPLLHLSAMYICTCIRGGKTLCMVPVPSLFP